MHCRVSFIYIPDVVHLRKKRPLCPGPTASRSFPRAIPGKTTWRRLHFRGPPGRSGSSEYASHPTSHQETTILYRTCDDASGKAQNHLGQERRAPDPAAAWCTSPWFLHHQRFVFRKRHTVAPAARRIRSLATRRVFRVTASPGVSASPTVLWPTVGCFGHMPPAFVLPATTSCRKLTFISVSSMDQRSITIRTVLSCPCMTSQAREVRRRMSPYQM